MLYGDDFWVVVPFAVGHHTRADEGLRLAGRYLFDTTMFRLIWGPAVHAMCAIVDNCTNEALIDSALEGLQVGSTCHFVRPLGLLAFPRSSLRLACHALNA